MCLTAGQFLVMFGSISDTSLQVCCESPVILASTDVQKSPSQVEQHKKNDKRHEERRQI